MSDNTNITEKTLSIYPTKNGFSFSYFESPRNLIDWGNTYGKASEISEKIQKLIDYYKPNVLITEDHKGDSYRRGKRIACMLDDIYKTTEQNDIHLKMYSRCMVKGVFDCFGANNQYETAVLLTQWYPSLSIKLPPEPKPWQWTNYRKGVFDSVSFAISYFYTEG